MFQIKNTFAEGLYIFYCKSRNNKYFIFPDNMNKSYSLLDLANNKSKVEYTICGY